MPGGGWSRVRLPAQIIATFRGHLSQQVKDIYSELGVGEEHWKPGT